MDLSFVSFAAAGHVNPTLPLVRELVDRGHQVTYATDEKLRSSVESAGGTLLPMPELALPELALPAGAPKTRPGGVLVELMRLQIQAIRDGSLERHLESKPPDAVCFDSMTLPGRVAADKLGLPGIALNTTYAANEHFSIRSLFGSNPDAMPAELSQTFEQVRQMSDELAAEIGGPPLQPFGGPPAGLNIVFIPREFQYEGGTFDDRFRFVGPCLGPRESDADWRPPKKGPLLFVSLGTTPFNNNTSFFRMCVEAFSDGPWQVAMAVGNQIDPAGLGAIGSNIQIRPFFPQLAVLRQADVFLSHTGMNSTMEALYYGVPIVAAPQQPEQGATARRIEQLGLGRHLTTELSPELLRATVDEVHTDPRIRANITHMSNVVRRCGGAGAAADAIEHHLSGRDLHEDCPSSRCGRQPRLCRPGTDGNKQGTARPS